MESFLLFLKKIFEGKINKCSVINCGKEITDNKFKVIDGKIFCINCATIFFSDFVKGLQ
jgi:formylmethanofuran dehydrogenase subunit E